MACSKCMEHRLRIREAIREGSAKKVSVETVKAMRTLNEKMFKRFSHPVSAKAVKRKP